MGLNLFKIWCDRILKNSGATSFISGGSRTVEPEHKDVSNSHENMQFGYDVFWE